MIQYAAPLAFLLMLTATSLSQAVKPDGDKQRQEEQRRETKEREDFYELLLNFADTIDQIDRNYVEQISRRELLEAAIEGALRKLDPYSSYIAPDEIDEFRLEVDNQFGGIGIQVGSQLGRLKVISPMVGTPAYRAGILAGDLILGIDGTPTKDMSVADAVKRMKGPPGSELTLSVFHPFKSESEEIVLVRERIKVDTVMADRRQEDDNWQFMYDPDHKIGYVRVTAFGRETAADLKTAITGLQENGLEGLVLDLRFNSGGLLRAAIEVADMFLKAGMIVGTDGRNIKSQVWHATEPNTFPDFPMTVLVNQFSASASEIVAAALQDHRRAVVIGQRTFGKASIQNVVELEEGRSALKLTTGSYQRPKGTSIHRFPGASEWGVQPDDGFEVRLTARRLQQMMAQRIRRDVVDDSAQEATVPFEDSQLDRAVDHLQQVITAARAAADK